MAERGNKEKSKAQMHDETFSVSLERSNQIRLLKREKKRQLIGGRVVHVDTLFLLTE